MMPNTLIKGIQDKLWIAYTVYYCEPGIDSIYVDSDKERTNIYDYLSADVLKKADLSMREDYAELQAEFSHERYKCARYYDDQTGWYR